MLYAIAVVMIALWLWVVLTPYTTGGTIHLLPVVAVVAIAFRLTRRQNVGIARNPDSLQGRSIALERSQSSRPG